MSSIPTNSLLSASDSPRDRGFLDGGGEMGRLMRAHDWSASPLGEPESWPQSLRTIVRLMLNSRHPMFVAWGPELAFLYNDGYTPIFGAKHPASLGLPFREVWSEIWDDIRPLIDRALAGEATWSENLHLVMERNGYPEDTWYTFSYSPAHDENGRIAGMFCACTETTGQVLAERARRDAEEARHAAEEALRRQLQDETDRLRALFEQAPVFMVVMRGRQHVIEMFNGAYLEAVGQRDMLGKTVREAFPELEDQSFFELLDRVYATGEPFVGRAMRVGLRAPATDAADTRYLDFVYQPIRDSAGAVTGILAVGSDVTETQRYVAALSESEARFRTLADNIPTLCWMADETGSVFWYNNRWYEYTGTTPAEMEGWGWRSVHDPRTLPAVEARWRRSIERGEPLEMTFPLKGADGAFRPFLTRVVPLRDGSGRIVRWFGTNTDVAEQQRYQQHLRLMVDELNHRVKNTLAIIQALVHQTLRGEGVSDTARRDFEGRLSALAAAHNLLTRETWTSADLADVARAALQVHVRDEARFSLDGPALRLEPKTAVTIAMALHELATNAAKYGALSTPSGRIDLTWRIVRGDDAPRLSLRWEERGGPPVTPPAHRGFGSRMIERALAGELNGTVALHFRPGGLVCEIDAPLPRAPEEREDERAVF